MTKNTHKKAFQGDVQNALAHKKALLESARIIATAYQKNSFSRQALALKFEMSPRKVDYMVAIWKRFGDQIEDWPVLEKIGWTKLAILVENTEKGREREFYDQARALSSKDLIDFFKGNYSNEGSVRSVSLRFSEQDYRLLASVLKQEGAQDSANGRGLVGMETALMSIIRAKASTLNLLSH